MVFFPKMHDHKLPFRLQFPNDLSDSERDQLLVLLQQNSAGVEDDPHHDVTTIANTVMVWLQHHGAVMGAAAGAVGSTFGLAAALINWRRERNRHVAEDKATQAQPLVVMYEPSELNKLEIDPTNLTNPSEEEIREFFERHPNAR